MAALLIPVLSLLLAMVFAPDPDQALAAGSAAPFWDASGEIAAACDREAPASAIGVESFAAWLKGFVSGARQLLSFVGLPVSECV